MPGPAPVTSAAVTWNITGGGTYATINSKGVLTAKAVKDNLRHEVTVRATTKDGSDVSAEKTVTIRPKAAKVAIGLIGEGATTKIDLSGDDKTRKLAATVTPADALQGVTWKSSSAKVVKVAQDGTLTGVAPGTATITATAKGGSKKAATIRITATRLARGIAITSGDVVLVAGGSATIKAKVEPSNASNTGVTWKIIEGGEYATIDSKGAIKAAAVKARQTSRSRPPPRTARISAPKRRSRSFPRPPGSRSRPPRPRLT